MDGLQNRALTIADVNDLLNLIERHPLVFGEKWCLIDMDWWRGFISHVEIGDLDDIPAVDNSNLCEGAEKGFALKKNLIEKQDFVLLPLAAFSVLRRTYGLAIEERDLIERTVVGSDRSPGSLHIEVYPATIRVITGECIFLDCIIRLLCFRKQCIPLSAKVVRVLLYNFVFLQIARSDNIGEEHTIEIFSGESFESIKKRALEVLKIDQHSTIQCYLAEEDLYRRLNVADLETVLSQDDLVVVDVLGIHSTDLSNTSTNNSKVLFGKSSDVMRNGLSTNAISTQPAHKSYRPGVCGLENLGNTCFMNSALQANSWGFQCLSNVRELTEYFLNGCYKHDINEENVLGMHGQLARAYADLMEQLWNGSNRSMAPRKLKAVLGQYVQQFSGYSQHDSQELLSFLLDGLHEDLNRVKKKVYLEAKDSGGRPDSVVAAEAWQMYKMGNDSVIVDYLHGQLKSTVVCPQCKFVSVKFDPFCFLSLPLPPKERIHKIVMTLVPLNPDRKWVKRVTWSAFASVITLDTFLLQYTVLVTFNTMVKEVRALMRKQSALGNSLILFVVLHNKALVRIMNDDESLAAAYSMPLNQIYAYQVADANDTITSPLNIIQVRNQLVTSKDVVTVPLLMMVPSPDSLSSDFITGSVLPRIREYFAKDHKRSNEETNGCNEHDVATEDLLVTPDLVNYSDFNNMSEPVTITGEKDMEEKELLTKHNVRKGADINECFHLFTRQELLSDGNLWYCSRCKEHQHATKKLDLWKLPPVLIIHLKRFHFTRWSREKIDIPVEFPLTGLDLTSRVVDEKFGKAVYDLIAVSNHAGGLGGGHYWAWARNGDDWFVIEIHLSFVRDALVVSLC
uniref:Ubiquitin carboxyl-terminal hydrolase n=1 Tax=Ascaris lumbricoides TaxID=6252 RepID=A0A9J2P6X9_ASCLU